MILLNAYSNNNSLISKHLVINLCNTKNINANIIRLNKNSLLKNYYFSLSTKNKMKKMQLNDKLYFQIENSKIK